MGDAWGGGVGGGWGAGLGVWGGLKGSIVGAREFLGHLRAYLEFYHRKEAVMYGPLLEVTSRTVRGERISVFEGWPCNCVVKGVVLAVEVGKKPICVSTSRGDVNLNRLERVICDTTTWGFAMCSVWAGCWSSVLRKHIALYSC